MASQTVTISVLADTKRFSSDMKSVSDSLGSLGRPLQQFGGGLKDLGGNLTNWITKPALGVAAAGAGIVGAFGWKRLVGLDTAKGQFKGLGYEGERLDRLMNGVSDGVTGTTLSMADGASIMVGALATGNLEMSDTEKHIKRVANLSAAYGLEAEHAGYLMNNVLTKNKVTWGDLSQMQQNNIPIVSQLADHYGVTGDEIMKMAQDGIISVEDLNTVIDKNAGAAAEAYANTWKGVTANILANLGKIGAEMLSPTFDIIKDRAQEFLTMLQSPEWAAAATAIGQVIGDFISGVIDRIQALVTWWSNLSSGTQNAILAVAGFAVAIGPVLVGIGSLISSIGGAILWFSKMWQSLAAIKLALAAVSAPVALVIAGIAALVAGLVWFFTQTELGQAIVEQAWAGIQAAASAVVEWFTTTALPVIEAVWAGLQAAAEAVVTWFTGTAWPALQGFWDSLVDVAGQAADWFNTHVMPVITAAIDLVLAAYERMAQVFSAVWGVMKGIWDKVGGPVMAIIGVVVTEVQRVWATAWGIIQTVLKTAWDVIKKTVETALGVVRGIITAITAAIRGDWSKVWDSIKSIFSTIWDGIRSVVSSVLRGIWDVIKQVLASIVNTIRDRLSSARSVFSSAWDGIRSLVSSAMSGIWNTISSVFSTIVGGVTSRLTAIRTGFSNAWNAVRNGVTSAFSQILSAITSRLTTVVTLVRGLPGRLRAALSNAGTALYQVGVNLIQGLLNGVGNMAGKIGSWFLNKVPGWIRGPLKKALGIKSPSKEFAGYGRNIGEGLIQGIDAMESKIGRATRDMGGAVTKSWDDPSLSLSASAAAGHGGRTGGNTYQITVQALAATPEVGRQVVAAIKDYERIAGPVMAR